MLPYSDSWENQKSEARIKTNRYLIEPSCKAFKLSIETLQEKTKPKVTEK